MKRFAILACTAGSLGGGLRWHQHEPIESADRLHGGTQGVQRDAADHEFRVERRRHGGHHNHGCEGLERDYYVRHS